MFALANAIWALPTVAAVLTPLLTKIDERLRDVTMVASGASVAVLTSFLAASGWTGSISVTWVKIPGLGDISFSVLVDGLSLIFMNIVAWASLAVFVYSVSYMRNDPGVTRYTLLLLLFLGGMELLVLSEDLLLFLFCWEAVSICSFLLISYWYQDSESLRLTQWVGEPPEEYPPSHCGLKAFLTTRFADTFTIVGALMMVTAAGTSSISKLRTVTPPAASGTLLLSLMLMAIGAMGKSAQVPFLEWLPDAMTGPSSVSALIHAATMVKAGVYLVARLSQLALAWEPAIGAQPFFHLIAWCGAITLLIAALQASATSELKKTLAYSTASQIGYMMAALGASWHYRERAFSAAVMHTVSHAFFKSSLFLAAGVIIHAEGSRFYKDLSGSSGKHRLAYVALLLSALSLMGVPPFAGYWSKEQVLLILSQYPLLFALALLTTATTAFYTVRMLILLAGSSGRENHSDNPLEIVPCLLLALAGLALGILYALSPNEGLQGQLAQIGAEGLTSAVIGATIGFLALKGYAVAPPPKVVVIVLKRRFYINTLYYRAAELITSLAKAVQALEDAYDNAIKLSVRFLVEDFGKVARVQVGVINLRELLWILALLALLLFVLAGW